MQSSPPSPALLPTRVILAASPAGMAPESWSWSVSADGLCVGLPPAWSTTAAARAVRGAREQDSNAQGRELTTDDALELRRQGLSVHEIALVLYGSDD